MRSYLRTSFVVALLCVIPALSACQPGAWVHLVINDFFSAGVDGAQLWVTDSTGAVARSAYFDFTGYRFDPQFGFSLLDYEVVASDGSRTPMVMGVNEDPLQPDTIEVRLWYPDALSGWYRVSDHNPDGESPLSADQVWLD